VGIFTAEANTIPAMSRALKSTRYID
jgi:hypothetical protein